MKKKIKQCPFCKRKGNVVWYPHRQARSTKGLICSIIIECERCGIEMRKPHPKSSTIDYDVVRELIEKWNKRE